ncbi:MAG: hypothetical protein LBF16_10600, partial [Pseudomonadales bacterium]|nr:hypothetical protein [Pseudomonadales bacterium]
MNYPSFDGVKRWTKGAGKLSGIIRARKAWRRAWIGTLGFVIVVLILALSGQARDVVAGIDQDLSYYSAQAEAWREWKWIVRRAYIEFWFSSAFLALILALAVRAEERHRSVTSRYSEWIFFGTLLVIHAAYLTQSFLPAGYGLKSSLLITCLGVAIASFILVVLPRILWKTSNLSGQPIWSAVLKIASGLLFLAFFGILFVNIFGAYFHNRDVTSFRTVSCFTPILALLALRSKGMSFLVQGKRPIVLLTLVTLVLGAVVLASWVAAPWSPLLIVFPWGGALSIVFVWLTWVVSLWASMLIGLSYLRKRWTWLFRPSVGILVVLFSSWLFREKSGQEWLGYRPPVENMYGRKMELPSTPPQPVSMTKEDAAAAPTQTQIAIHADGGGLRAALYTAVVLALADDRTCGDFGAHVFAASGVSGGSLGIATWAVMRAELVRLAREKHPDAGDPWLECKEKRKEAKIPDGEIYPSLGDYETLLVSKDELTLPLFDL